MIDSHAHLFDPRFDEDLTQVFKRATAAGITGFILPATMDDEHDRLIGLCKQHADRCFPTMGLHPLAANDNPDWRTHLERVERLLDEKPVRFVAIGETGIDMHWSQDFLEVQQQLFEAQIQLAIKHNLPLVIHTREAWDETLEVLEPYAGKVRGVFHSFSGTSQTVERTMDLGFMYGINGTVTYKKSTLPEALEAIPLERILLETDAPYLPPEPHRGQRNEPSYTALAALKVAALKNVYLETIDNQTTQNTMNLFAVSPLLNVKNNI